MPMIIFARGIGLIVPKLFMLITLPLTMILRYLVRFPIISAIAVSLVVTGILLWLIDNETLQKPEIDKTRLIKKMQLDTFCFIRVKYWGAIMVIGSIIFAIQSLF